MAAPRLCLLALIAVGCNSPPTAPTVAVEPTDPQTDDALSAVIEVGATDPDGDDIDYRYEWSLNGQVIGDLVEPEVPPDRTRKGQTWAVSVIPFDEEFDGEAGVSEVTVRNTPPTVTVQLSPEQPATEDALVASFEAADIDEDEVEIRLSWSIDGEDAGVQGAEVPGDVTQRDQVWGVTATPFDGEEEGPSAFAEVTVGNSRPEVLSVTLTPSEAFEGSIVEALWTAADLDEDALTADIQWVVERSNVPARGDGRLDGTQFDKGDRIQAEVTVSDGVLESGVFISDVTVVNNTPPTATGASISPLEAYEDSTLSVSLEGFVDVDGDAEGVVVQWQVNGADIVAGGTLHGAQFDRDDVVSCQAAPDDGEVEGTPVSCTPITIRNTAPALAGVTLTPGTVRTADGITAVAGATSDLDGDPVGLTYAWTVDGVAQGVSSATFPAARHEKGDVVQVSVTPADDRDSGVAQTASVTIANTPPTLTTVSMSPSPLRTDDTAGVSWAGSDVDGDTVTATVSWTVDGTSAGTGSSLSGTSFAKGDKVVATVVPNDGTDDGSARTLTRTVANTAPMAPTVRLSPATPDTSNNVRCVVATAGTDADGDTLSYSFTWTRNGSTVAGTTTTWTNDTLRSGSTSPGDRIVCTARASDGTATSGTVTASGTVIGAVVSGFSGVRGPSFSGWTQCEGYKDGTTANEIPKAWGDDCTAAAWKKLRLVCGASTSAYRYIDVNRNVFRDKLTAYPHTGLILQGKDHGGTSFTYTDAIYAASNDPHVGTSWWAGSAGCSSTSTNLTVNNSCTYEASNCFGQGLSSTRFLWVYVSP